MPLPEAGWQPPASRARTSAGQSIPIPARTSGGAGVERLLQALLGLVAERALEDLAAVLVDARNHLVGRHPAHEHEQRRAAGRAGPRRVDRLVQLDLAARLAG